MQLFNSHTHTNNSLDCDFSADEMCLAAIDAGLSGYSICDHCHGSDYITYSTHDVLKSSFEDAICLKKSYSDKIEVLAGAEFGEILWHKDYIDRLISKFPLDIVLASVHRVRNVPDTNFISRVNFKKYSEEELNHFITRYFEDVLETAQKCDFDSLSHLTLIYRYVCGKYKISVDYTKFDSIIDEILKTVIKRNKALELNTSEINNIGFMPDKKILTRYRELGGSLVTIGSDAHKTKNISLGMHEAINLLKECGFKSYVYFKGRKPQTVLI